MRRCLERVLLICGWFVLAVPSGLRADPLAVTYNSVNSQNEIRRLEPANGETTLLNGFTFDSGASIPGSFVLDAGVGALYAVSSTNTLYTFSATTRAVLSTVPLDMSLRIIALELRDGNTLLGIAYNPKTSQYDLWSVSPITGQTTLLNSFTFDYGYSECGFVADRRGGRVYAVSSAGTLHELDLYTGAVRSTVPLDTRLDALALRDANTPVGITYSDTVPADYDGDGKVDPTVFRDATGTWYQLRSTTGPFGFVRGVAGDVPM